jgi:hypothetical protein
VTVEGNDDVALLKTGLVSGATRLHILQSGAGRWSRTLQGDRLAGDSQEGHDTYDDPWTTLALLDVIRNLQHAVDRQGKT